MNEFREAFERGIDSFNRLQKEKFAALDERQQRLVDNTEKRLEEIRVTVDEKLQKTLTISRTFPVYPGISSESMGIVFTRNFCSMTGYA